MMSGCGGGAGHVKIKIVRGTEQSESGGVNEEEVVFVTKGPRRRGRPKKPIPVVPRAPRQPLQRYQRPSIASDVVFITAPGTRPSPCRPPPPSHVAVSPTICRRPIRCVVSGITSTGQVPATIANQNSKINWPRDVQELVNHWDDSPEKMILDVKTWLQSDASPYQKPKVVCKIQNMWTNMPETWEEKVDLALEWLQDGEPPRSSVRRPDNTAVSTVVDAEARNCLPVQSHDAATAINSVTSPPKNVALLYISKAKVLVEAQPTSVQDCGQWSSMMESRENSNP